MKINLPIVLIGPMATGKSTVANEIAKLTGDPRIPMDRVRWYYYLQDGFSLEKETALPSFTDRMEYWKPFEVSAVKKIVLEFPNSVIDFGAGHSYFPEARHFNAVKEYLAPIKNIFLLMPSEDKEESLKICNERLKVRNEKELDQAEIDANRMFIEHPSNYLLSKHVVYTKGETPKETAQRIFNLLS